LAQAIAQSAHRLVPLCLGALGNGGGDGVGLVKLGGDILDQPGALDLILVRQAFAAAQLHGDLAQAHGKQSDPSGRNGARLYNSETEYRVGVVNCHVSLRRGGRKAEMGGPVDGRAAFSIHNE
jgi:hypothetical protein